MSLVRERAKRTPRAGYLRLISDGGNLRVLDSNGKRYRLRPENATPVHYVAQVLQSETAAVVAAGGATADGDLVVTVTAAGMTGSPLALDVALTEEDHGTAVLIAAAIRAKLSATAAVMALFTVGGATHNVTLTRKDIGADTTANLAITAGLGVTAVTNSTRVTYVARVMATVGTKGDQLIDDDYLYTAVADVAPTSTAGWEKATVEAV